MVSKHYIPGPIVSFFFISFSRYNYWMSLSLTCRPVLELIAFPSPFQFVFEPSSPCMITTGALSDLFCGLADWNKVKAISTAELL